MKRFRSKSALEISSWTDETWPRWSKTPRDGEKTWPIGRRVIYITETEVLMILQVGFASLYVGANGKMYILGLNDKQVKPVFSDSNREISQHGSFLRRTRSSRIHRNSETDQRVRSSGVGRTALLALSLSPPSPSSLCSASSPSKLACSILSWCD